MPDVFRLRSLAKINLDLRVLHRRPDGFHELRSIFQTISLADTIDVAYQRGRTRVELDSDIDIADNLIVRAADSFLKATRATGRLRFALAKRIPMGGGLGGGSSNAATVLLALPAILRKKIALEKLIELAAELGSDVPFFLTGGTAVGLGRGTELYPLPDAPPSPGLLITPGIHSSTASAYAALKRETEPAAQSAERAIRLFQAAAWTVESGINDFETVVFAEHPQLKSMKGKLLASGARRAMMTGSGSALFGLFAGRELRDRAAVKFRKEFSNVQVHSFTMVSRSRYRALWWRQLGLSPESTLWPPQDRYAR